MYEIKYRDESELKDSGFEWLGKIPRKWSVCKLNLITDVKDGTHDTPRFVDKETNTYPLITSKNICSNKLNFDDVKYISEKDYILIGKRSGVEYGDIIMPMIGTIGNPCIVNTYEKFAIKNLALFKLNKQINNSYLFYQLESEVVKKQFAFLSRGGVQSFVSLDVLRNLKVMKTNFEQQKIANFLDIKTAQFDKIISKKEQLIEKLEEAKKSLISEVVTGKVKIVDGQLVRRDASEMKESGVEWLGMIPSDWTKFRLKDIAEERKYSFVDGPFGSDLKSDEYVDEGIPLIQLNNIRDGKHIFNKMNYVTEKKFSSLKKHSAYPGEIVFAKMAEPVARCCKVSIDYEKYTIVADCIKMKPKDVFDVDALIYFINTDYVRIQAEILARGTTRVRINLGNLKELLLYVPEKDEQISIRKFLDNEVNQVKDILDRTRNQILKLKQAKQSLISEAVIGKINLRDWEIIEEGEMQ